jgi:hypothetical protein
MLSRRLLLGLAMSAVLPPAAWCQTYPAQPVRVRLARIGPAITAANTPAPVAALARSDGEHWATLIRERRITLDRS